MSVYGILIILSGLLILSYLFAFISRWSKIPSVMFLMATGMLVRRYINVPDTVALQSAVSVLGSIGLVMIILESALDIRVSRGKLTLMRDSFLSAALLLGATAALIAYFFRQWLDTDSIRTCLLYAVPLSVISSAIVLPSIGHLEERQREFITFEASFSDILGIVLFNYLAFSAQITPGSAFGFLGNSVLMLVVSVAVAFALVPMISLVRTPVKSIPIFAILVLLYATGKIYHFSSLIFVLLFGLAMNNFPLIAEWFRWRAFDSGVFAPEIERLKLLTVEISFLVRSYFFFLFGYTINPRLLIDPTVLTIGGLSVAAILLLRLAYMKVFLRIPPGPEFLMTPRGLVTVLLFYSIPEQYRAEHFSEGVVFFVIVATNLLMTAGLLLFPEAGKRAINGAME